MITAMYVVIVWLSVWLITYQAYDGIFQWAVHRKGGDVDEGVLHVLKIAAYWYSLISGAAVGLIVLVAKLEVY